MKTLTSRFMILGGAFLLAGWLASGTAAHAVSVLVFPPSLGPKAAAEAMDFALQVQQELRLYPKIEASIFDPQSPRLREAVHLKILEASEVKNPGGFGAAVHIGTILGCEYVVLGVAPPVAGRGEGALANRLDQRTQWNLGDVQTSNLTLLHLKPPEGSDPQSNIPPTVGEIARELAHAVADRLAEHGALPSAGNSATADTGVSSTETSLPPSAAAPPTAGSSAPAATQGSASVSPPFGNSGGAGGVPTPASHGRGDQRDSRSVSDPPIPFADPSMQARLALPAASSHGVEDRLPGEPDLSVDPVLPGEPALSHSPALPGIPAVSPTPPGSSEGAVRPPQRMLPEDSAIISDLPPIAPPPPSDIPSAPVSRVVLDQADSQWRQAQASLKSGQFVKAAQGMLQAISLSPENSNYKQGLADLLLAHGQPASAAALYQDAVTAKPFNADLRLSLGQALLACGDTDGATAALHDCARIAPDRPDIHFALARILMVKGDNLEAIPELRKAAPQDTPMAAELLGNALARTGDPVGAVTYLAMAIHGAPTRLAPREQLADVLLHQGQPAQAIQVITQAIHAGLQPDPQGYITGTMAVQQELEAVTELVAAASPEDLKGLTSRIDAAMALDEGLSGKKNTDPQQKHRSAAASDLLQAITERQHLAPGDMQGDVTVLISHARQLLKPTSR